MKIHDTVLQRGLKERRIHMGLSSSYLRKLISEDAWGKWILKQNGYDGSHWHSETYFDEVVKKRIEESRKVELADRHGRNRKEDKKNPYCGNPQAPIAIYDENLGTWVTKTNKDVMMFKEEKPEVIDNGNVEATYKAEGERYGRDEFDPPTHQSSVYNEGHYTDPQRASEPTRQVVPQPGRTLPPPPASTHIDGLAPTNLLVPNHPPLGATGLVHQAGQYAPHHGGRSNNSGQNQNDELPHRWRGHDPRYVGSAECIWKQR